MSDCFDDEPSHFPPPSPPLPTVAVCLSAARSPGAFLRRPANRRHTRASRVCLCHLACLDAAYSPPHSPRSWLSGWLAGWLRTTLRGYVGEFITRAEYSTTAPSRATLAGHRPMPCYGAVNAKRDHRPSSACGSSVGHPNSSRANVYRCVRHARRSS